MSEKHFRPSPIVIRTARLLADLEQAHYYGQVVVHFAGTIRRVTQPDAVLLDSDKVKGEASEGEGKVKSAPGF